MSTNTYIFKVNNLYLRVFYWSTKDPDVSHTFKVMKSEEEKWGTTDSFACLSLVLRTCQKASRDVLPNVATLGNLPCPVFTKGTT